MYGNKWLSIIVFSKKEIRIITVIIQEVYNTFKEASVSKETAHEAAEALTGYGDRFHDLEREIDCRFNGVDQRFSDMEPKIDNRFNEIEREVDRRFNAADQRNGN